MAPVISSFLAPRKDLPSSVQLRQGVVCRDSVYFTLVERSGSFDKGDLNPNLLQYIKQSETNVVFISNARACSTFSASLLFVCVANGLPPLELEYPLEPGFDDDGEPVEHPLYYPLVKQFLKRVEGGKLPFNNELGRLGCLKNLGAVLVLREVHGTCDAYTVPTRGYNKDWIVNLEEDEVKIGRQFLESKLGLKKETADAILLRGNPYSWWRTRTHKGLEFVMDFQNNVCNWKLQPSQAKSAQCNKYQPAAKKQRKK